MSVNLLRRLVERAAQNSTPLARRARRKLGLQVGDDAALELIEKNVREGWATVEIAAVLSDRAERARACRFNTAEQAEEKRLCFESGIEGFFRFARNWAWTFDPRLPKGKTRPFLLLDKQKDFKDWLEDKYVRQIDGVVEKSRDMGFSWLAVLWVVWRWLSEEGFTAIFVSNLLRNVERLGDPKSIFEKIRTLIRFLPSWMLPSGYRSKLHSTSAKITNPANGASITGEGGKEAGRSGRASIVFVDEAAHVEQADSVEAALSSTSECRIWGSTPKGTGNLFYRKAKSGMPLFRFHWLDDPRKNSYFERVDQITGVRVKVYPWYERQKIKFAASPLTLAQEIDISYASSVEGAVFPTDWVQACLKIVLPASAYVSAGLDVGETGDKSALTIRKGPVVTYINEWGLSATLPTVTASARKVVRECEDKGVDYLSYDANSIGVGVTGEVVSGKRRPMFRFNGVKWGSRASKLKWPNKKRSFEMFEDNKTEQHWLLRERMRKTFEHTLYLQGDPNGIKHNPEDMVQLPHDDGLIEELAVVMFEERENFKIKIESKRALKKRGVKSPNKVDSLVLAFAPEKENLLIQPSHTEQNP